uniref:AT-hook transcription factor n=1 Tax=Leptobrachium leishanense TaxID=445787 RepID=A0A8C5R4D5_9ANUR
MDTHIRLDLEDGTGDEDDFSGYMDENGVIGMEEQGDLGFNVRDIVSQEEEGSFGLPEQRILGLDERLILGLEKQDISYPDPPSDDDRSGVQSWEEQFSFSHLAEDRSQDLPEFENSHSSDIITEQSRTADDLSPEDHPDMSLSLLPPLDWRPPSRDQQLDMTEDERDRGSSIGKSEEEGEDAESDGQSQSDLPYDDSRSPEGYGEYGQTTAGEDEYDDLPIATLAESYFKNPGTQEDEPSTFSHSPSPYPNARLLHQLGGMSVSPGIEDETLPESSCTDSADGRGTTSSKDFQTVASNKAKPRTDTAYSSPAPPGTWNAGDTKTKPSKSSPAPLYGRGQLNYPLPDLSKVGPRVKLPRDDQIYRPPQSRRVDAQKTATPVIFKSPAEIVREVLQSSTDTAVQDLAVPRTVPQEFQTPQQATVLVHQLQEDYHKLLTKYAEAENTIDRLRLGAKINLFSDPPKPSHSVQMGSIQQGSKIMEFTIPQVHKASFSLVNETNGVTESWDSPTPASSPLPEMSSSSPYNTRDDIPTTLTSNIELLQQELDHFGKLLHKGSLTPTEQQQALLELRGSLDMLEQQYLKARGQYHQGQQHTGSGNLLEELDPSRALETAIYHLGIQLDELQDKVQDSTLCEHSSGLAVSSDTAPVTDPQQTAPVPSALAPIPALITPYPEVLPHTRSSNHIRAVGDPVKIEESVAAEELPQTLRHKQMQVEQEYDSLLSTYNNFKTLPNVLGLEQDEWPHQEETRPLHHPQMTTQHHSKPDRSEVHFQIMDQPQTEKPRICSRSVRLNSHPSPPAQNDRSHDLVPRSQQEGARLAESPRVSRPRKSVQADRAEINIPETRGSNTHKNRATPREHQQEIHGWDSGKSSPEAGKYTRGKSSIPKTAKDHVQRISLSSPSTSQLRDTSSRSQTNNPSVSGDSARGPYSRRSSYSSKSVSSSAQKEQPKHKEASTQDRIVSPETDSGFLGSESGQSPLRKKGNQLQQIRESPPVLASPPNSYRATEFGFSISAPKSEKMSPPRASWGKRVRDNQWLGPSETSSPSPGPKSLTESESGEQSHDTGDTDTERDRDSVTVHRHSSASQITLSPPRDHSQNLRRILETRTARDEAIQALQKEVIQLRQHLESSLSHASEQERPAETLRSPTLQFLREERLPRFARDRLTSPSNNRDDVKEPRAEPPKGNSMVQDSGRVQPSQGRHVYGDYTGTLYHLPDTSSSHRDQQGTAGYCQRCQDGRRRSPGHVRAPAEAELSCPVHPSCPLCNQSSDSAETPRTERSNHLMNKRRQRSLRVPPCEHWIWNQTPPVTYLQSPLLSLSAPVIYGPSSNLCVPVAYSTPERRPQRTLTPPPSPVDLDDLHWPLNRALEAATELKLTSKRMCRSLTSDLGIQRSLRGSCLF